MHWVAAEHAVLRTAAKRGLAATPQVVIHRAMPQPRMGLIGSILLVPVLTGCSTTPVADLMDFFRPGRLDPGTTAPYGGVCTPRPVAPAATLSGPLQPGLPVIGGTPPGPAAVPPPGSLPAPVWPDSNGGSPAPLTVPRS
jgi:hypothetical protein